MVIGWRRDRYSKINKVPRHGVKCTGKYDKGKKQAVTREKTSFE
jgi:hypothetical protein